MDDLLALDSGLPSAAEVVPTPLVSAHSPLQIHQWEEPNSNPTTYEGSAKGLGLALTRLRLHPAKSNMASAGEYPQVISSYWQEECGKG